MSSKRSAVKRKDRRKLSWRCPKCQSTLKNTTKYPAENMVLHVCKRCRFPQRVKVDL